MEDLLGATLSINHEKQCIDRVFLAEQRKNALSASWQRVPNIIYFSMENLRADGRAGVTFQRFPRHMQLAQHPRKPNRQERSNKLVYHSQQFLPHSYSAVDSSLMGRRGIQGGALLREGRYRSAGHLQGKSVRERAVEGRRARTLEQKFQTQREVVKSAHQEVMRAFHLAWHHHFQSFREREMQIILSFKQSQDYRVQAATQKLQERCETHHSPSPTARMNELLRTRELMMKMEDFKGLAHVRQEMKRESGLRERRREEEVQRWRTAEEIRLSASQTKKYGALVSKLDDQWQDGKRIYLKEQKRLRRKYKNYVADMEHCHALYNTTLTHF